jgi:hypothetical protein
MASLSSSRQDRGLVHLIKVLSALQKENYSLLESVRFAMTLWPPIIFRGPEALHIIIHYRFSAESKLSYGDNSGLGAEKRA